MEHCVFSRCYVYFFNGKKEETVSYSDSKTIKTTVRQNITLPILLTTSEIQ